jgi:acyl-CoA synthetase (AMP-forming)/AMP-acid ligase II
MPDSNTIPALLTARASDRLAIADTEGSSLSYTQLAGAVTRIAEALAGAGVHRSDRIAIVTRNGPAAALGFLGAATAGVAAPLNPAYRRSEFEFALSDLPARVLLTDGSAPAAIEAAAEQGVTVLSLSAHFTVKGATTTPERLAPDDIALVLHTSGTTGRPKRVPLTHANLAFSAANIARSLDLRPADRCLNVMPLFHIHGLIGVLLASLHAGSSAICTPGFDAFKFLGWLEDQQPSWYSAVPTIHQAVLSRSKTRKSDLRHSLRFIRSASSALPPSVLGDLETTFGVPVIEAYGMTEASHQVAANPLPPGERRPGSVGIPAGVEVRAFTPDGQAVPAGNEGEIGIRGPSVTAGYEDIDPSTFTFPGGWLRTGDQGRVDADGYVWLTGRLKEVINRGGEKISPREVEEVLLSHPSVAEAVVFALAHDTLGEDVGAAVVPAAGISSLDVAGLRSFATERLAAFKVPGKVAIVEQIPLGPTGKAQRVGMAARLGLE